MADRVLCGLTWRCAARRARYPMKARRFRLVRHRRQVRRTSHYLGRPITTNHCPSVFLATRENPVLSELDSFIHVPSTLAVCGSTNVMVYKNLFFPFLVKLHCASYVFSMASRPLAVTPLTILSPSGA